MTLRLIEMVLKEKDSNEVLDLLKEHKMLEQRHLRLSQDEVLVRILLDSKESEPVLDLLEKRYANKEENRIVILPVEATLPRDEPDPDPDNGKKKAPERISREELYENIKDSARCSKVYLTMVILSTIVAAIGLQKNNVAIIIGAMVIAPLLGPNIALALGTTLGDLKLLRRALLTDIAGIAATIALSTIIGVLVSMDQDIIKIVPSMRVGIGSILVALASGCAGALSFTTGISAGLIGVMVAVALLPPLVTFGLLLGGGYLNLSMVAFSLFLMNLICINLASVITFLVQGIHPMTWWKKGHATKATLIAISLWVLLLLGLVGMILILRKDLI